MVIKNNEHSPSILIIGNLGYIGSVLTPFLRSKYPDAFLSGFDIGYFAGCVFSPLELSDHQLNEQIYGDVRDFDYGLLDGVDYVIYLAAISNDPMGSVYANETRHINALSAVNIAEEAKVRGVKSFTFASSCSIYGSGGDSIRTEDSEVQPLTAYAKSKVEGENLLRPIADKGFSITCLRFATACGASPRLRLDLVLNDFVVSAIVNKKIEILSDGTPWRPLIALEDMCEALDWGSRRPVQDAEPFLAVNAGFNSWNFTVIDLANLVATEIGDIEIKINPNALVDKRSYKVSFDRYGHYSGNIISKKSVQEEIALLRSVVENSQFFDKNFRESNFMRLKVLRSQRGEGRLSDQLTWVTPILQEIC
jgi:nucleoside-diphosphate-sugar epimerase